MPWSAVKEVDRRQCRIGFPNQKFWALWKADKDGVKRMGIEVKKEADNFVAYWWNPPVDQPTESARPDVPELRFNPNDLPESIRAKLRPYQIEPTLMAVHALKQPLGAFLNASGLGSGKTYVSLAAALAMGKRVIIVARLGSVPAWREVACQHFGLKPHEVIIVNREKLRTGKTGLIAKVTKQAAGRSWKEWEWTIPPNHILIYDECHNDAGLTTTNSEMLCAAARQKLPILMLSATAADEPTKMRAIGYVLGLHNDSDFYAWMYRNGCERGDYGFEFNFGYSFGQIKNSPLIRAEVERRRVEVMHGIHNHLKRLGRIVRVKTSEIPGFPKTQIIPVAIDFQDDQINEIYREMQEELDALARKSKGANPKTAFSPAGEEEKKVTTLEIMMRARQRTELLKVPGLVDEVNQVIQEGGKCAVFLNFKDSVRALADRLETNCIFDGDTHPVFRETNRRKFQQDEELRIILNTQAGGESIGLHDITGIYPVTALIMPSFWMTSIEQAKGRVCRDGGKTPSIQKILFAANTIEQTAYEACCRRKRQTDAFNGEFMATDEDLMAGLRL